MPRFWAPLFRATFLKIAGKFGEGKTKIKFSLLYICKSDKIYYGKLFKYL